MPLLFIVVGVVLMVVALRDTYAAFFTQLATDAPGYMTTAAAIAGVGVLGFIPGMENPARLLLVLIFIVLFLKKDQGVYAQFLQALANPPAPTPGAPAAPVNPGSLGVTLSGSNSLSPATIGLLNSNASAYTSATPAQQVAADVAADPTGL